MNSRQSGSHPVPRGQRQGCGPVVWGMVWLLAVGAIIGPGLVQAAESSEGQQDCRVYETKRRSVTVGLKAGNFLFNVGPEVTWALEHGVAWDQAVQGLIARYVELCTRYNAGQVSPAEYDQRIKDIDALYRETLALEAQLIETTHQRARDAYAELEEATSRKKPEGAPGAPGLQQSVDQLATKVQQLEPAGQGPTQP